MGVYIGTSELKNAYIGEYIVPYLCFTANTAESTVRLYKNWSPTTVTLETSTDGESWSTYTMWATITLSNVWDKVYFKRASGAQWKFSTNYQNNYYFRMSGSINGSGDVTSLLCSDLTTDLTDSGDYCLWYLFRDCTSLVTPPNLPATILATNCYIGMFSGCTGLSSMCELPATELKNYCYKNMFSWCSSLSELPILKATTISEQAYMYMFRNCTNIKLSASQTWEYQTEYRIPTAWTWTWWTPLSMFQWTWWTFTWTPTINTTYYTSNTLV